MRSMRKLRRGGSFAFGGIGLRWVSLALLMFIAAPAFAQSDLWTRKSIGPIPLAIENRWALVAQRIGTHQAYRVKTDQSGAHRGPLQQLVVRHAIPLRGVRPNTSRAYGSIGQPHYEQSTETRCRGHNQGDRKDSTYRHCANPRLRPSRTRW